MLENLNAALSRIGEIKSRFSAPVETPQPPARPASVPGSGSGSIQPFFPDYLVKPIKQSVKASVEGVSSYDDIIESAAAKNGLDPALLKSLIQAESGFNANAVSRSGAQGLTQLMPSTAGALGVSDPFDPAQNIEGGARYLKRQLDRFGDVSKALAAYNAGPGAVAKYNGVPPYRETQNYVNKVLSYREAYASK